MSDLSRSLKLLYRRNLHEVRLGLEATLALLEKLGRPQDAFLSIHVAGTNGKGSVCAMIDAVLREAGFRVGLYTSPHLVEFNERIAINGERITNDELDELLQIVEAQAKDEGTFFEFTTALAFEHFRRKKVQIAVLETGMGGRLDATNVVDPLVSVITSIGLDHTAYLGNTIEQIAAEKAGIIKPGRSVVVGDVPPEAMDVIRKKSKHVIVARDVVNVARKNQTLLGQRVKIETNDAHYGPLTLSLAGSHQLGNCAVAVAALEHIRETFSLPIPNEAVTHGLEKVKWPARFEVVSIDPPIVVDGAHNPEAAAALMRTLDELGEGRPIGLVVSFLADKDGTGFIRELAGRVRKCWAVPIQSGRAMPLSDVVMGIRAAGLEASPVSLKDALREANAWAMEHRGLVCVTGSLYLAGEALHLLKDK